MNKPVKGLQIFLMRRKKASVFWGVIFAWCLMACGILEFLFPPAWPQRYIARDIEAIELEGAWELTSQSLPKIAAYIEENDLRWGGLHAPWRSIILKPDGSCEIELEISWDPENDVLKEPDALATCSWEVKNLSGYDETGSLKQVSGVQVRFEYFDQQNELYRVDYSECYVAEEDNRLVLWNFIGNPAAFQYQDFVKK